MSKDDISKEVAIEFLDALGVGASSLCAVHCIVTPFIIGFLPTVGAKFLGGPGAHQFLAFWVVFFCLTAIVPGYLRHRQASVLALMLIGLSCVLYATFFAAQTLGESWEIPLITIGNVSVIVAHLLNRKLSCSGDHQH